MAATHTFLVTPTSVLTSNLDLEARLASATSRDTVKGMFYRRVVEVAKYLGVTAEAAQLQHAQPGDRYSAFGDYPVTDYFRWVAAVGRAQHPRVALPEAMRRVSSHDFTEFAESRLGSVMLAFTGTAKSTLGKSGAFYAQVLKGPRVESEETPTGVTIRYREYAGPVEFYPIGTIEGTCKHYRSDYSIEVSVLSPRDADYVVRLPR
jgi:uncharacterized protein (TIGR02265 family)